MQKIEKDKGGIIMKSNGLDYTALVITVIGALNWGLIGLFRFNLVTFLFGDMTWLSYNTRLSFLFVLQLLFLH